jgi:FMN phosphatase YigB (HAD superfamily)
MLKAVIFDLDDTLLDTSALAHARRRGQNASPLP